MIFQIFGFQNNNIQIYYEKNLSIYKLLNIEHNMFSFFLISLQSTHEVINKTKILFDVSFIHLKNKLLFFILQKKMLYKNNKTTIYFYASTTSIFKLLELFFKSEKRTGTATQPYGNFWLFQKKSLSLLFVKDFK